MAARHQFRCLWHAHRTPEPGPRDHHDPSRTRFAGFTDPALRAGNGFDWEPIREVGYLFAGIFTCIIPVMAMLDAGNDGPFAPVISLLTGPDGTPDNAAYFWATGLLSSFLDNAPTYLVFFHLASGDPAA